MSVERNIDPNAEVGMRIKLIKMHDDPNPVEDDMEGTINHIDSLGTLHVTWDNGRNIGVIPNHDEYVLTPTTQKDFSDMFDNQEVVTPDDLNTESLSSFGRDKAVINRSMPKTTLKGSKATKGGQTVQKNWKSSLSKTNPKVRDIKVEDEIKGGEADKLTVKGLAEKHGVSVDDIKKELKIGVKIEMEHTDNKTLAKEIAMDHIAEFPDYYSNKKYGTIASEKGLEKVNENTILENFFGLFGKKDKDTQYDAMQLAKDLKKVANSIKGIKPAQEETVKKMIENFRKKYYEHSMIDTIMKSLYNELDDVINVGDLEETTATAGGGSTGAFVGPLDGPVKRDKVYEPKQESKIIKFGDLLNEIADTKITKIRDAGSGYDANPWVGDKDGDGWNFNDDPAWPGGKIVDILAKLDINWVDHDLSVTTNESFQKAIKNLVSEVEGKDIHTAKWKRCVKKVKKSSPDVDPYAVCTDSIGYEGSIKKPHRRQDESEELEETTTFGDVWGADGPPVTPTFAAKGKHIPSSKPIWKGGTIVQKIKGGGVMTEENTIKYVKGGKFVKIKDKCAKYKNNEHCSQGAIDDPLQLSDTTFKNVSEVAKKTGLPEEVIIEKIKTKITEDKKFKLSWKDRMKIKMAGIDEDQVIYNLNNGLPIDWKGTKEGYYQKHGEGNRGYSGSN